MDNKSLSEKVLALIKEKKIQRKAKWTFLLRDWVVRMFGFVSLLVGGLAFSVIMYMIRNNSWEEYSYTGDSFLQFMILSLPYFWIGFLVLFVIIADYNIRHTKKGYRYRLPVVVFASVFVSTLLGGLFYSVGMGQAIDDILSKNTPYYEQFINPSFKIWQNPEKGLYSGVVISANAENELIFQDINGKLWTVIYNEHDCMLEHGISENIQVRIFGENTREDLIEAEKIVPMFMGRRFLDRNTQHIQKNIEAGARRFNR